MLRATPHSSTGKSPAELLFGRKFRTKIPDIRVNPAAQRDDIIQARQADVLAKARMKALKDSRSNVKPHSIKEGDSVILKRKSSKANSPYDPEPFDVTNVRGTQITAERGQEVKTRDAQRWKKVRIVTLKRPYPAERHVQRSTYTEDPDIGAPETPPENILTPPNSPISTPPHSPPPPMRPQMFRKTLNDHPDIIRAATPANRPQRNRRQPKPIYEPPPRFKPTTKFKNKKK